jgi:hypothetical protein
MHRNESEGIVFGFVFRNGDDDELGMFAVEAFQGRERTLTRSAVLCDELDDRDVAPALGEIEAGTVQGGPREIRRQVALQWAGRGCRGHRRTPRRRRACKQR